jgi:hypothetical protein
VFAAAELARSEGLRVDEPAVLADLLSLMVHLRPAPVVARVATTMPKLRSPIDQWMRLELDVTSFLAAKGAPVVAPSPELPPGPHRADGFAITFWTYLEADPDRTPTTADCAVMLVDPSGWPRSSRIRPAPAAAARRRPSRQHRRHPRRPRVDGLRGRLPRPRRMGPGDHD